MYDRMVNHHGLKNLIWVWTREPNDDDWYPGDAYIDIVGRDIYREGDHNSQILEWSDMNERYGKKKMITISECGSFPDVDNLVKDGAAWSYYMPWYGGFVRESKYNTLALWNKMFNSEYVLTLDEMPDLKTYEAVDPGPDPDPDPVTSIEQPARKNDVNIYPTEVDDSLYIEGESPIGNVKVLNSIGQIMIEGEIRSNSGMISFSGIKPGLYYVKVRNHFSVKILKK
jgi:mannan endo-1,4-beta-mannosidase